MSRSDSLVPSLSRRRFLGTSAGGFAAAMLAGGVLPHGAGSVVMAQDGSAEFHIAWPYLDPGAGGHFNSFVTYGIMNSPNVYGDLMLVPNGLQYWVDGSWMPLVAESWEFTGKGQADATPAATPATSEKSIGAHPSAVDSAPSDADALVLRIRQGVMWSTGDEVTAQDFVDTFHIYRMLGNSMWDYLDEVEALDDYTVSFSMKVPSTVVERYVIRTSVRPSSVYGEWAQQLRDLIADGKTSTDSEWVQLNEQFISFRPEGEMVVNGPYTIDQSSITSAQLDIVKNESSYWADNALFDKLVNYNGETDSISALVLSKDTDYATQAFPVATEQSLIEAGIRILRPPTYSGTALKINFAALPQFLDKRVRQALAHAIDRDQVGVVALASSGVGVKQMSGMSDNFNTIWLTEETISQLNPYEYDLDKATSLLEEAGWSKDGDTWKDADGNPAEYDLIFPSEWADYFATGGNVAEQLTAFGIRINPNIVTFTQLGPEVSGGKFQMAIQNWGASSNPHPYYSYANAFFTQNARTDSPVDPGISFPLVQETEVMGEVDIDALIVSTAEGMDQSVQRERIAEAALVFNELLNVIPLYERFSNHALLEGVRVQPWPADDDPIFLNGDAIVTMLMLDGQVKPVE